MHFNWQAGVVTYHSSRFEPNKLQDEITVSKCRPHLPNTEELVETQCYSLYAKHIRTHLRVCIMTYYELRAVFMACVCMCVFPPKTELK